MLNVLLRLLTELPVLCPELATEGTLWFSDLLVPDTTLILPLSVCLLNLAIIEVSLICDLLHRAVILMACVSFLCYYTVSPKKVVHQTHGNHFVSS